MNRSWTRSTGAHVRAACRSGQWDRPTAGMADGFVQANIVMLPADAADDFQALCEANPIPCPLLERTPLGNFEPAQFAPGVDLRTDAPRYRVYRNGVPDPGEPTHVLDQVQPDMVGFLLGCSFTFESAMASAGFELRHQTQGVNVPMYQTTRVPEVCEITARNPRVHGAPVHAGDPATIGIEDINQPDWGEPVEIRPGEVLVFWGCGVTPQAVAQASRPALMITHAPGHMFVTDWLDAELERPPAASR